MSRPLGSVVVDEQVFPIVDVRLDQGAFLLRCEARGPLPAISAASWTVHDEHGGLVYRSSGVHRIELPVMCAGSEVTLTVKCEVIGKVAESTGVTIAYA